MHSEMSTNELRKTWEKWDAETIDSYRLRFRIIDLNEDGLINFGELWVVYVCWSNTIGNSLQKQKTLYKY